MEDENKAKLYIESTEGMKLLIECDERLKYDDVCNLRGVLELPYDAFRQMPRKGHIDFYFNQRVDGNFTLKKLKQLQEEGYILTFKDNNLKISKNGND